MKNKIILSFLTITFMSYNYAYSQLIITGIMDGDLTGGEPKVVELYATEDIADITTYSLEGVFNAASRVGSSSATALTGTSLNAGNFYYVVASGDDVEFNTVFGFAPNLITNEINMNGDDDLYLYKNSTVIDVWGGSDGVDNTGTAYDILDGHAYRNNFNGPNTTFNSSEWSINKQSVDGQDAAGHNTVFPEGTYLSGFKCVYIYITVLNHI